jgi:hypothetical protein
MEHLTELGVSLVQGIGGALVGPFPATVGLHAFASHGALLSGFSFPYRLALELGSDDASGPLSPFFTL